MNKLYIGLFMVVATLFVVLSLKSNPNPQIVTPNIQQESTYNEEILIDGKKLTVEIVSTPEKISLGLGGRESISMENGMLFDFRKYPEHDPTFWMKDMKFAIDIIWISDGEIVGIEHSVQPPLDNNEKLDLYPAPGPVEFVLETIAGYSNSNDLQIGDTVIID